MNVLLSLKQMFSRLNPDHQQGEFDHLKDMDDLGFQTFRAKHLARKPRPYNSENIGIFFLLSLTGAPASLVLVLFTLNPIWFVGVCAWLGIGVVTYFYLAAAAKYWREHYAIIHEEIRRYGANTFG